MTGKSTKLARKSITLKVKLNVLQRISSGERQVDVCKSFGMAGSTVRTIIKNRDKILECSRVATPLCSMKLNRTRPLIMLQMEKQLSDHIEENVQRGVNLSSWTIRTKAEQLHDQLTKAAPRSRRVEPFCASKGWLERFNRRIYKQSFVNVESTDDYTLSGDNTNVSIDVLKVRVENLKAFELVFYVKHVTNRLYTYLCA